jgi:hypothetical protein
VCSVAIPFHQVATHSVTATPPAARRHSSQGERGSRPAMSTAAAASHRSVLHTQHSRVAVGAQPCARQQQIVSVAARRQQGWWPQARLSVTNHALLTRMLHALWVRCCCRTRAIMKRATLFVALVLCGAAAGAHGDRRRSQQRSTRLAACQAARGNTQPRPADHSPLRRESRCRPDHARARQSRGSIQPPASG